MNPIMKMMKSCINMPLKKALPLLFIFSILIVSVTGCTDRQETVKSAENSTTGTPPSSNSKIDVIINSKYEANQLTSASGYFTSTPQPGNKFAVFSVTVKDLSQNDLGVSSLFFKMTDSDGSVHSTSSATLSMQNDFSGATLQPGEKLTGIIAFEIPHNTIAQKLTYQDFANRVTINLR